MVAPANFYNYDADEDDEQGFVLKSGCQWDEVEDNKGKKRIRFLVISPPALWPVRKHRSTWLRSRSPILPRS
jgi:hypothetical protein